MPQFLNLKLALSALVLLASCQEPSNPAASTATPVAGKTKPTARQLGQLAEDSLRVVTSATADTGQTKASAEALMREQTKKLLAAGKLLERMERAHAEAEWVSLRPYLILAEPDPDQLSLKVSARLHQGYLLRGPMYVQRQTISGANQPSQQQEVVYVQNMILLDSLRFKIPEGYRTRVEE